MMDATHTIGLGGILSIIAGVGVFFFAIFAFAILSMAFTFWMMVDAAIKNKFWWLVLITLLNIVGAGIYYFVVKREKPLLDIV